MKRVQERSSPAKIRSLVFVEVFGLYHGNCVPAWLQGRAVAGSIPRYSAMEAYTMQQSAFHDKNQIAARTVPYEARNAYILVVA